MNEKHTKVRSGPRHTGDSSSGGPAYSSTSVAPVKNCITFGNCSMMLVCGCLT